MTAHSYIRERTAKDADAVVVFASEHGHTRRIATRIADAMRAEGLALDVRDVADADHVDPARYDLVVAASVHKVRHQKAIATWVEARREALAAMPSAFVSVSLSAAEDSDTARAAVQQCIDEFCADTGWTPTRTQPIAGCLQYREYDPFTRQFMRHPALTPATRRR